MAKVVRKTNTESLGTYTLELVQADLLAPLWASLAFRLSFLESIAKILPTLCRLWKSTVCVATKYRTIVTIELMVFLASWCLMSFMTKRDDISHNKNTIRSNNSLYTYTACYHNFYSKVFFHFFVIISANPPLAPWEDPCVVLIIIKGSNKDTVPHRWVREPGDDAKKRRGTRTAEQVDCSPRLCKTFRLYPRWQRLRWHLRITGV